MSDASQKIPFPLRLPDELRAKLEHARSGRSLNAEIIQRLEASFSRQSDSQHLALLHRLERQLSQSEADYEVLKAKVARLATCLSLIADSLPAATVKKNKELHALLGEASELSQLLDSNLK
jgi:hypothetical protein